MVSVFDYTDYRKYLHDYYTEQKKRNPAFSYRYFAQKANINSSGLYKNIIDGRRGLSRAMTMRFSAVFKHSKKEAEYFESMVFFNDARTLEEKKVYFERMLESRESKARLLDKDQYEYYSKWYYAAIREVLSYFRVKDDFAAIARELDPAIRPDQAEKAFQVLEELGMIRKNEKGFYEKIDVHVTTGPEVASLNVANYQIAVLDLAKGAIDRFPAKHRDMSTLTLGLSPAAFTTVKSELIAFRKKLLAIEENVSDSDRIYQLNFQLFPLTKINENRGRS